MYKHKLEKKMQEVNTKIDLNVKECTKAAKAVKDTLWLIHALEDRQSYNDGEEEWDEIDKAIHSLKEDFLEHLKSFNESRDFLKYLDKQKKDLEKMKHGAN